MSKIRKKLMSLGKMLELMDGQADRHGFIICKYLGDHLPENNSLSSDQELPIMYF